MYIWPVESMWLHNKAQVKDRTASFSYFPATWLINLAMTLNLPHMDQLARTMNRSFRPVQAQKKTGKENARSLRRHYPVQVQRDYLSLTCWKPSQIARAQADKGTPGASLMLIRQQKKSWCKIKHETKAFYYWGTRNKQNKDRYVFKALIN